MYREGEFINMNEEMQIENIYIGRDCLYGLGEKYAGNERREYDFYKLIVEEGGVRGEKFT